MKKKIISGILLSLGAGLLVFYFVAPDVFMNMLNTVVDLVNKPLPIVGVSVAAICVVAFKIFASSSVGKKAIEEAKKQIEEYRTEAENYKTELEEYKIAAKAEIDDLKTEYNDKLNIACSQFDYFETSVIDILGQLPNQKVQQKLIEFKDGYDAKKEDLGLIIDEKYSIAQATLQEVKELKDNYLKLTEETENEEGTDDNSEKE